MRPLTLDDVKECLKHLLWGPVQRKSDIQVNHVHSAVRDRQFFDYYVTSGAKHWRVKLVHLDDNWLLVLPNPSLEASKADLLMVTEEEAPDHLSVQFVLMAPFRRWMREQDVPTGRQVAFQWDRLPEDLFALKGKRVLRLDVREETRSE